jgi:hypothetical protein
MDMWNWLQICYLEGSLSIKDMEDVLEDSQMAKDLWNEFVDNEDFILHCQEEVASFYKYIKNKNRENEI